MVGYVNGSIDGSASATFTMGTPPTAPFTIGNDATFGGRFSHAYQQGWAYVPSVLTQPQLVALYAAA